MITIKTLSGLCNRLRVLFSHLEYARSLGEELAVVWRPDIRCNCLFLNHFKPICGVSFITEYEGDLFYSGHSQMKIDFSYADLAPNERIMDMLHERLKLLGPGFSSVHIRRTDHVGLAMRNGRFTPDEQFINFIDSGEGKVFMATDNPETRDKFQSMYPGRVVCLSQMNEGGLRRTTSEDAILDIYTCVHSSSFKGSDYSSFTKLIEILRKEKLK